MLNIILVELWKKINQLLAFLTEEICFILGGEDRGCSYNTVERYDPIKNEWTTLPGMHRKRAGAGICVCDTKIYVAGNTV